MNEKEKMLKGKPYEPLKDKELERERISVKDLCIKYNSLSSTDKKEKNKLIKKIIGKTGKKIWVEPNFYCDYGYNIEVGENFYINHNCVILDCAKVKFGNNVFIGPNCGFYTAEHPLDYENRNKGIEWAKPIKVGDNVWIGGNVTVLAGVTIGSKSVIGAGSVVVKDIPSNCVAVGNPCKVIKKLSEQITMKSSDDDSGNL